MRHLGLALPFLGFQGVPQKATGNNNHVVTIPVLRAGDASFGVCVMDLQAPLVLFNRLRNCLFQ